MQYDLRILLRLICFVDIGLPDEKAFQPDLIAMEHGTLNIYYEHNRTYKFNIQETKIIKVNIQVLWLPDTTMNAAVLSS